MHERDRTNSTRAAASDPVARHRANAKTTWSGASLVLAAELLLLPTGLITAGFLTRQLGTEGYALFTLAATVVGWLQWLANSTLARAAHRTVAGTNHWRPVATEVIRLHVMTGAALGGGLLLLAPYVAQLVKQPAITWPLRVLSFDLVVYAAACGYRNVLIGIDAHRPWATGSAARWLTRVGAIVLFVSLGWGVIGAVLGIMAANVAELFVARRGVGPLPASIGPEKLAIRQQLQSLARPVGLSSIALRTFDRADLLLLAMMSARVTDIGHYGAAQNLTVIVSLITSSVSPSVLASVVGHRRDGDAAGARRIARDALRLPLLVIPFLALAAGSAAEIMTAIYGANFTAAAAPFRVLLASASAVMMVSVATGLLVATDRSWHVVRISVPMLLVLVLAAFLLIPRYGPVGAALASSLAAGGGAVAALIMASRAMHISLPLRSVMLCTVLAIVAYWAGGTLETRGTVTTIAKLSVGTAALAGALVATGELRIRDFREVFRR